MKRVLLFIWIFISALFLITSCEKDNLNDEPQLLTGVFSKEEIIFDEDFQKSNSIMFDEGELYFVGKKIVDGLNTSVLAVLDTESMDICYKALPTGDYSNIAISGESYLLLESSFSNQTFKMEYMLQEVNDEATIWKKSIAEIISIPDNYLGGVYIASANDRWYIGAGTSLAILSKGGSIEKTFTLPSDINGIQKDSDCRLHIWGKGYHKIIDKDSVLNDVESIKAGVRKVYFTKGYDYCYSNENGLYGYSADTETDTEIMNWTNSGIVFSRGVSNLFVISTDTIYIYGSDGIGGKTGLWKYTKANDISLDDADIIRVTYIEDGNNRIPLAAVKFNAAQVNYRIVLNEYSSSYSDGELMDSFDKAILSGNIGDIVVMSDLDCFRKYAENGLFADLYALMNDEWSPDDVFGCVRKAYEVNEKLFGLPSEFKLDTYVANYGNIDFETWDTEAFIKFASSLENHKRVLLHMTQSDVYYILRDSAISECIDLEKHTCSFDSNIFRQFLLYIASLPKESTEEISWNENNYINGKVALYRSDINSYAGYYQMKSVFGEEADAEIVGYPLSNGGASKLTADAIFSITESSKVKEEAMVFLKYLLSADCVIDEMRGMRSIPALKTTAKAWDEIERNMYYYFYYDNVGRWSSDTELITKEDENSPGVCIQLTQERIDEVYDFLNCVNVFQYIPSNILAIVDEDVSMFLNTKKTVDETAKIIQNRVSTYLNERK